MQFLFLLLPVVVGVGAGQATDYNCFSLVGVRVVRQSYSCASPCADGTGARDGCPSSVRGAHQHSELIQGVRLQFLTMFIWKVLLDVFSYFLAILVNSGPSCDFNLIVVYFSLRFSSCVWT